MDFIAVCTPFCYCVLAIGAVWPLIGIIAASVWIVLRTIGTFSYKQSPHGRDLWTNLLDLVNFLIYGGAIAAMITWILMTPAAVPSN